MREAHYDQFIGHYPALVPPDVCMKTIKYFEEAHQINASYDRQSGEGVAPHIKSDTAISFNFPTAFEEANSQLLLLNNDVSRIMISRHLQDAINDYVEVYSALMKSPLIAMYHKVQKTKIGQGYHVWHFESGEAETMNRSLVYSIYLNDVQEGGETEFLYQHKRYAPRQGDVLIFPAHFTHTHRGNPPLSNEKYIVTGWLNHNI
jgi:hypothetical protein